MASRQYLVPLCVLVALGARASEAPAAETGAPGQPDTGAPRTAPSSDTTVLPTINVTAPHAPPAGPNVTSNRAAASAPAQPSTYQTGAPNVAGGTPVAPQMASEMVISGADLNARPVTEPAEVLEAAPGLAVVQHSGSGKANQYYLRGYNLDHGTDMATFWDDVPINLPTNAHGQGYTDLNFLIPETISGLEVRKGPYWADVGDFDNAGALNISLRDSIDRNIQSVTMGSFGYSRFLNLGSAKVGGGSLLYAGEFDTNNGPWATPEDVRKFSGLLRYSQGTATDGFSATAVGYANNWNASRSGRAAGDNDRTNRPVRGNRPHRWGRHQPLHVVDQAGALRRRRVVEGQRIRRQIHTEPLQQLHLVHDRSAERRSIPSV